jgi:hypothetical protein
MADICAGLNNNSSLRKKLTANRDNINIPWTKYMVRIAINSGVSLFPKRICSISESLTFGNLADSFNIEINTF